MKSDATTPEAYLERVAEDRRAVIDQLRALIRETVPAATEHMQYGMLGYAIDGRPFAALAAQKNYLALYLMDLYTQPGLREAHAEALSKLDVGKSCIRFQPKQSLPLETFRAILAVAPTAVATIGTLSAAGAAKARAKKPAAKKPAAKKPAAKKPAAKKPAAKKPAAKKPAAKKPAAKKPAANKGPTGRKSR